MTNLFQIMDECGGILPILRFIRKGIFPIIQIGIPILLILMGTIDLGKAVMSNDDKEIKGATGKLIKRAIAAIAVFFVTTIVTVVFSWLGSTGDSNAAAGKGSDTNSQNWLHCWEVAGK